jgi:2-polyprenyl-6-methoxyphenol hydroxylase-like FAD-dependent oxidoreductase
LRIACVGGGPAGLYFVLALKLREPRHDITLFERSAPGVTRGWAVSLWDDLLEKLYSIDPESAREIQQSSFVWNKMIVDVQGEQLVHAGGRGYGMGRQRLLEILARRALAAGVHIEFEHEVTATSQLPECDLIVGCDGVNSRIRNENNGFQTDVRQGRNKYIWLGTDKIFEVFTRHFVHTDSGWLWSGAHAYGANSSTEWSSFTVECSGETWAGLGFDTMPHEDCLARLEKIFERPLDGHRLIGQASGENAQWLNFRTVTNKHWHDGKTVLAGDAAHTAHFSIGSGTKLAIEDAIALADNLQRHGEVKPALEAYEQERRAALTGPQIAARLSAQWLENVDRYIDLKPHQFATLLHRRRSPLLPYLPPRLGYWLYPRSGEIPGLGRLGKWAARRVIKANSRLRVVR